jgi:hypothetical protein
LHAQIEDIHDRETLSHKFPKALAVLTDALTVDLKAGESLFIPSFTWVQVDWQETGLAVNHFGWVNIVAEKHLAALALMEDVLKQHVQCTSLITQEWIRGIYTRCISFGRHPKGIFPGAPVCPFAV